MDAARHAAHVLGEAVARVQAAEASLREVFRRDVLDLDLEGLCVRFDTVHRGLGKLRLAFWRDRAAVARCALSGRARNAERSRLRDALEWKRALARLEASQRVHADQLGSEYFGGLDTDFVALAEALEIAGKLLLVLRSETASPWNVAALTLASPPDHEMGHRGRELGAAVAALRARLQAGQGLESPALPTEPLDVAADWCRRSASALLRLSELLRRAGVRLGREVRVAALRSAANLRAKLDQLEDSVKSSSAADTALLGPLYRGAETNPIHVAEAVEGATEIRVLIGGPMEAAGSDALRATSSRLPALRRAAADWNSFGNSILAEFKEDHRSSVREGLEAEFAEGRTYISALAASIDDIDTWGAYSRALASLAHEGLGGTIAYCVGQALPARLVPDVVTRAVLEAWADQAIRGDKRLQQCRAADRDLVVQEFRDLDKQLVRTSVARVVEACNRLRPSAAAGAVALIVRESQKQRRHMPTRRLLADAGPVVQAVKPCFMMSPLTVSQFLPPTMKFDAVVFDEASQVRPCDAIGCIYRGRQLIVAGDQKQLPPTAFFERVSLDGADDRWDEDQVEEFESVLDLCRSTAGLRPLPLLWHYRSRHEDLISFSNYSFYEGRLITFPGARHQGNDVGVELFRVPGVYRRGAARDNPIEAEKVVERVLLHVSKHPTLSLGVVAFSEAQAAAIDLAIEQASKSHPELAKLMSGDRLNGFFVKNLENVQGDERDIMIFSIGYGPDENGKFALSFGPINRAGGERRLNVAITRARLRVEVVSSIGAADFQGTSTSPGVLHLKKYLDFAGRQENKIRAVTAAAAETGAATESPFEDEVLRVVRSWGYDAVPQVGCAGYRVDIGVKHPARPGSYLLGIECDGASYHSARAARDRDRLRQSVLEGLGWRLHRIWGPAWYRTRAEQVDRLRTCLDSALGAQPPVPRTVSVRMEPPASVVLDLDSPPCWTRPYHVAKPTPPPCPVAIHHHSAQTHIVRMITEVVDVESPVCSELVLERIREAWGLQRAGSRVRDAFDEALRRVLHVGQVTRSQTGCLVASGRVLDAVRVPDSAPATRRTITEMPREEIAMAVQRLVADVRLISRDELPVRVARLFGWGRTGSEIAEAIERVVLALLDAGVLRAEGDQLRPMEATPGTRPSGPNAHPGRGPTS
ncbi:MAG: DUF3320 domain-containing protein [Deltaproteobacteria bacterium]|nr:DUF3320 domain-containing protein [Deltaproteobacteria bacterium]